MQILDDQGTHLLITDGSGYAVIERRNNRFYNCHGDSRDGIVVDDLPEIAKILNRSDWMDKKTAQTTFDEVVARGNQLAQYMR